MIATGLAAAGAALIASGRAEAEALVVLLIAGVLGASVNAASGRAIMHWFGAEQRGLALGLRQTAVTAGGAAAAVVVPAVEDVGGTDWALAALGIGCLATAALSGALLREGQCPAPDS